MEQILFVLFYLLVAITFVIVMVWDKIFKKLPDTYIIISFTLMGGISIVNALFSESDIEKAYMLAAGIVSLCAVVCCIISKRNYKKVVKEVKELEEYHRQNAKKMAEEAAKEIEQIIAEDRE
jgi:peptidoglycan/LPS O-acetylase OafA/YrhL